ncbi:MAG: methionyl-tRNA formyltransferase, partial [Firmicutes bacterium]|nr:methionyl-tRNA formyltransferase [Bacillota bacterium]
MKTVFMGTPEFAEVILRGLHEGGHEIQLVLTQPDRKNGRGKQVRFSPVKEAALELGIDVLQPENLKNDIQTIETLKTLKPDVLVVASYGQILPKAVLDIPRLGAVNVHASLLPKLRGASPIQHAILEGMEETGITIMRMDVGLDTGDMILKRAVKIGDMNYSQLHDVLAETGRDLLLEALPLIENGTAEYEKQDGSQSTYAPLIRKEDGHLDFSGSAACEVLKIRAFDPWPGAFAYMG